MSVNARSMVLFLGILIFSEDEAMDVDSSAVPTSKEDDLSQYNLDEYDDDAQTTSKSHSHFHPPFTNICY